MVELDSIYTVTDIATQGMFCTFEPLTQSIKSNVYSLNKRIPTKVLTILYIISHKKIKAADLMNEKI